GMYTFLQEGEFVQITVAREEDSLVAARQYGTSPTPKEATATDRSTGKTIQMTYDPPALEKTAGSIHKPRVVTGFISRFGDLESDKGAFLDHFFTKGSLYGDEISFTTKQIHGVWYAFKGKVERGMEVKAPAEEGYYVIRGRLQRLSTDTNKKTSAQEREVVLKSFPDLDADAESGKKN
ncbi:MAG TPA: hypothetical protein VM056_06200, partial [Terriglobales bacterium]|nr:hypothetical protein [Terriglobales bacterium]